MQQILVLSIKEFYRMAADVDDEISKLEEQNENHNVIIEKVGDDIRISITEAHDISSLVDSWRLEKYIIAQRERDTWIRNQPIKRNCPNCGSEVWKKVDRRFSTPVRYWCDKCEQWLIFRDLKSLDE